jgi:hypothetical protein
MIALLVVLSQIISGMPSMLPGTHVRIVMPDLMTVIDVAVVENNELIFQADLEPNQSVRLLISYSPEEYLVAPRALVNAEGDDILVYFDDVNRVVSLREWLEERGIRLVLRPGAEGSSNSER